MHTVLSVFNDNIVDILWLQGALKILTVMSTGFN